MDESYVDEAQLKNEADEKEAEEKADQDHPLTDKEKEELGLLQEVIAEKPAEPEQEVEEIVEK